MKNLRLAVRLFRALAESQEQVSPATLWSYSRTRSAVLTSPCADLVEALDGLGEEDRSRVLRYTGSFEPLKPLGETYVFPSAADADSFTRDVAGIGGFTDPLTDCIVSANGDDARAIAELAAGRGGTPYDGPSVVDAFESVDSTLPYDMLSAGIPLLLVEKTLLASLAGRLDEQMDGFSEASTFRGRLHRWARPRPRCFGVDKRLVEGLIRAGMLRGKIAEAVCSVHPGLRPLLMEQEPVSPGEEGAEEGGAEGGTEGGVSQDQQDAKGTPAQSKAEPQDNSAKPTEVDREAGGPGGVKLSDGTVVPEEVLRQALGKLLHNLATQLEQGTVGGKPPEREGDGEEAGEKDAEGAKAEEEEPTETATTRGEAEPRTGNDANAESGAKAEEKPTQGESRALGEGMGRGYYGPVFGVMFAHGRYPWWFVPQAETKRGGYKGLWVDWEGYRGRKPRKAIKRTLTPDDANDVWKKFEPSGPDDDIYPAVRARFIEAGATLVESNLSEVTKGRDHPKGGALIRLGYATYNVFQQYWDGQRDPLYAVLSRRGPSVDWVELRASQEEIDRLREVAREILSDPSAEQGHTRTAQLTLDALKNLPESVSEGAGQDHDLPGFVEYGLAHYGNQIRAMLSKAGFPYKVAEHYATMFKVWVRDLRRVIDQGDQSAWMRNPMVDDIFTRKIPIAVDDLRGMLKNDTGAWQRAAPGHQPAVIRGAPAQQVATFLDELSDDAHYTYMQVKRGAGAGLGEATEPTRPLKAYDIIQVMGRGGEWMDYSTLREPDEFSMAIRMVRQNPGKYRIVDMGRRNVLMETAVSDAMWTVSRAVEAFFERYPRSRHVNSDEIERMLPGLNPSMIDTGLKALRDAGFLKWGPGGYSIIHGANIDRSMREYGVAPGGAKMLTQVQMIASAPRAGNLGEGAFGITRMQVQREYDRHAATMSPSRARIETQRTLGLRTLDVRQDGTVVYFEESINEARRTFKIPRVGTVDLPPGIDVKWSPINQGWLVLWGKASTPLTQKHVLRVVGDPYELKDYLTLELAPSGNVNVGRVSGVGETMTPDAREFVGAELHKLKKKKGMSKKARIGRALGVAREAGFTSVPPNPRTGESIGEAFSGSRDASVALRALLSGGGGEIDAWGLSRSTSLQPMTAERALNELVSLGYAVQDGKWYSASDKAWAEYGHKFPRYESTDSAPRVGNLTEGLSDSDRAFIIKRGGDPLDARMILQALLGRPRTYDELRRMFKVASNDDMGPYTSAGRTFRALVDMGYVDDGTIGGKASLYSGGVQVAKSFSASIFSEAVSERTDAEILDVLRSAHDMDPSEHTRNAVRSFEAYMRSRDRSRLQEVSRAMRGVMSGMARQRVGADMMGLLGEVQEEVQTMLGEARDRDAWIFEQLDVGEGDEASAAAKGFKDAADALKACRQNAFALTTDALVRLDSLTQAVGAKKTAKMLAKIREQSSGFLDSLKALAEALNKANDTFKSEGGKGGEDAEGDAEQDKQGGGAGGGEAPPSPGEPSPAPPEGEKAQAPAQPAQPAQPTPEQKAESAMRSAVARLVSTSLPERIRDGEPLSSALTAIAARCPDLHLTEQQQLAVYHRLRRAQTVAESRTFRVTVEEADRGLLEDVGSPIASRTTQVRTTTATEGELFNACQALRRHGGIEHRHLAEALEGMMSAAVGS